MKRVHLLLSLFVIVAVVVYLVSMRKEGFVPVAPSKTGDQKQVTPSGHVILY